MAKQDRVAVVYAQALAGAAAKELDAVEEAFNALVSLLGAEPRVREFLASPTIPAKTKHQVLSKAFAGASPVFLSFLAVVLDKGRGEALPGIHGAFRDLRDKAAGRIRTQAVTASAMSPEQAGKVQKGLEEKLGGTVVLEPSVRPQVMGGIRLTIGDWVADATLERKLKDLSKRVAGAQPADGAWAS